MTSSLSRCRCARTATSTRASGSGYRRSSKACGCSSRSSSDLPGGSGPGRTCRSRAGEGLAIVEGFRGDILACGPARRRRPRAALPSPRSVLVPVAAARGGDRGQHRRRFPALQQIVQLLLFGARPLGAPMRKLLFQGLFRRPLTEPAPAVGDAELAELASQLDASRQAASRPQPLDPRGRCRLVQRLRARDPCAEQRLLRPRAFRPALRRLAAPCRRASGHRTGHQEHAQALELTARRDAGAEMGGGGRRLRPERRHFRRVLRGHRRACREVVPVDLHIPGCPPTPTALLQGLLALLRAAGQRRREVLIRRGAFAESGGPRAVHSTSRGLPPHRISIRRALGATSPLPPSGPR